MRRDKLAFGVIPSDRRFRLRRAKFPVVAEEVAALAAASGRPPRVLDAGMGQAKLQRVYQHVHADRPVRWVGLDLLAARLELQRDVPGIERVQGDAAALPFADAAFDAAVCSYVLQHLEAPEVAVGELARVLRPGGRLLLAVPNAPQPLKLVNEVVEPLWIAFRRFAFRRRFSYGPQVQFFNLPRVRSLVEGAGLRPIRWQGLGFVTGGPLRPLEDLEGYYRANLWAGARLPRLGLDLLCVAEKA